MAIRSFLAFELPAPMRTVLAGALEILRGSCLDARWAKIDNIHLTVVFLGDVPEDDLTFIMEAAQEVCSRYRPFEIAIKGLGVFGPPRRPRVLWAGLTGETMRMAEFQQELLSALAPSGIKYDGKAFKPHLTLGRFRGRNPIDPKSALEACRDIHSNECLLENLVLFKSDLTPRGAFYTLLGKMPMAAK
jgi:RNA 2',3'-cyclic 3'-phosphodiesterase